MKPTKILLIILLLWIIPSSIIPIFDLVIWFPLLEGLPADDLSSNRLLAVRSATFMTLAYFIVNHLRQKKPLSSVSPIFVFINFIVLFSSIFLIKNGGPKTEWLMITLAIILSGILYFEGKKESNKIFKDAW